MATYAIGDIQGCFDELIALLEQFDFNPKNDRLWLVGDLVNRGPKSLEVLRFVKDLGERVVMVLGNHDLHLVAVACGIRAPHRKDTLDAILNAPDRDDLIDFLRRRPLAHREGDWLMVHAGLLPQWSATDAVALSDEVVNVLCGPHYQAFLHTMYGNLPDRWDDSLQGADRWRVIINAMTRMRIITADGQMEFQFKDAPDRAPAGFLPWYAVPAPRWAGSRIVCGHWSALGYLSRPELLALDSGCLWGGALTAVRLEDAAVFQLPCNGPAVLDPHSFGA